MLLLVVITGGIVACLGVAVPPVSTRFTVHPHTGEWGIAQV